MQKPKRRFRYANNVMAMVMAGAQGSRLNPLTDKRSKLAVDISDIVRIRSIKMHKETGGSLI